MDVAELISNEIHKFVLSQITTRGTTKPLGFLSLIIDKCHNLVIFHKKR